MWELYGRINIVAFANVGDKLSAVGDKLSAKGRGTAKVEDSRRKTFCFGEGDFLKMMRLETT